MRRLLLSLYHKQIFSSTPITSFSLFLSYIVVTPLMIGFEKDFSCHSHLGPIRIPPLFPFPSAPFPRNEKEDGTLELYDLSVYCFQKILLLQLVGHRVIQISRVFRGFPMLELPYQFGRSGIDRLNIPLGSLVLTLLCGIHSRSALGITSSSGWNSSQNPTTSPTSLPPTLSRTSIETEWFHVLSSIGYSSTFVSFFLISVSISSQDWMANSPPDPRFDCFPRMLSRVCKPCIWEELLKKKEGLSVFFTLFWSCSYFQIQILENSYKNLLEERNYICPISSDGGTNQDVCRPTRPQTLSSRPIWLSGRSYLGGIPRLKRSNSSREHTKERYELGK